MSRQNVNERAQVAALRTNIYGLLSRIFICEVDARFLEELRQQKFINILKELGVDLGQAFLEQPIEEQLEDLAVEYTRLFLGPGKHLSPHESVYVSTFSGQQDSKQGLLWGAATVKVNEFIEEVGYQLAADYPGIPDHLGVELGLMQQLAKREETAWQAGDIDQAAKLVAEQDYFLREHILKWVPQFCQQVATETVNDFYRVMAKLTQELIAFDHGQTAELAEALMVRTNH